MGMTVREVLVLPVLRGAEARVLAGEQHLDRSVRWVHVAELPDISYLLKGGELLLTTGMGIQQDEALRRRYINELADAGVAGLVVELGRNFARMPAEMITQARRRGLPLIALGREIRFVEVTEQVHRAIINQHYEMLDMVETISRDFTDTILGGASIGQVVRQLADIVGNPVILENSAHQVVEFAADSPAQAAALLPGWAEHSRAGHAVREPGRVHREDGLPGCTWAEIWLRHEAWGRVHVLEYDERPGEMISLIMDRAAATLGLALLSQQDVAHLADRAGSALIADLHAGRYSSAAEILQRALSLGADLSGGRLVAVVVDLANLAVTAERRGLTEAERQRIRLQVMELLRAAIAEQGCTALTGIEGDRVLAVVAARPSPRPAASGPAGVLTRVAGSLQRAVAAADGDLSVVVGVSRETSPEALRQAFEQAAEAAEFGRRSPRGGPAHHFGDLGTYHLLVRLAQGPELAAFIESELSPLLAHDARSSAKLIPTLEAYLGNACRKTDAARELWIQRRTLYGRLARIERLLGRSLDDQDTRTRLTLALQGLGLLRER
jgi:PucR family transcriptional regulator, purine catabolism regulatory protein